ncbi:uncharacterized protein [Diadema setosum]|uniref:uncharacterized protein n=1 Tax=Diadema setosum TaxID=31175 RepID=UPI003B3B3722
MSSNGLLRSSFTLFCIALLLTTAAARIRDEFRYEPQAPTKGRHFVFAFMDNCLQQHEDAWRGPKLSITAPPDSASTVFVNVSMPLVEVFDTATIPPGGQAVVRLSYQAFQHGSGIFPNGIRVDASDDVFVYGLAEEERHSRSEGFLALPVSSLGAETDPVEYFVMSMKQKKGNTRRHSQFAVVGIDEITEVTIRPAEEISYNDRFYALGSVLKFNLTKYQVLQFKSLDDLTGTQISAPTPVAVLSGVDCGTIKLEHSVRSGCGHMVEQLPPTRAWGKYFVYRPLMGGPRTRQGRRHTQPVEDVLTKIRILKSEDDTNVIIGTSSGRIMRYRQEIDIRGMETVYITSMKPVLVAAFALYHGACQKGCKKRSPTMTLIPPLSPAAPSIAFATINATDKVDTAEMNHYLSVLYDCACFRRLTWGSSSRSLVTPAGYSELTDGVCWSQYQVPSGYHTLSSGPDVDVDSCFLSSYVFGHGTHGGYGFPVGLDGTRSGAALANPSQSSAVGSEFYVSFATYFPVSGEGPRLFISRAEGHEDSTPIQGSVTSGRFMHLFTIPAGERGVEIRLPASVILRDSRDETGSPVEVRAFGHVLVHGLNDAFSDKSDAFLALPRPMMGMEYFIVGSVELSSSEFNIFIITGLHNDTLVSLGLRGSLSFRNRVHYAGTSVEFSLRRKQALFFMSYGDHTGTHVVASKPISVMSGTTCGFTLFPDGEPYSTRCGHMLEHLLPVERWGHLYAVSAFRGYSRGDTTVYIMASRHGTEIRINDGRPEPLRPGNVRKIYLSEERGLHALIDANQPVLVYQVPNDRPLNHTSGFSRPSQTLVPSLDAEGQSPQEAILLASFNIRNQNDTTKFANLATRCSAIANIALNGVPILSSEWSKPLISSEVCVARKRLDDNLNNILNTGGAKVSVVLYGFSPTSGYSCPGMF